MTILAAAAAATVVRELGMREAMAFLGCWFSLQHRDVLLSNFSPCCCPAALISLGEHGGWACCLHSRGLCLRRGWRKVWASLPLLCQVGVRGPPFSTSRACTHIPSSSLCGSSQPTVGSMMATSIAAQLEAWWSLVTWQGSRQGIRWWTVLCAAPGVFRGGTEQCERDTS